MSEQQSDFIPVPDTVRPVETPAPAESAQDRESVSNFPEADKAAGADKPATPEAEKPPELTEAQIARKERNRERWRNMKSEREDALRRASQAEAELTRFRTSRPDYSRIEDPDESLAARTADKLREGLLSDHEARITQDRARAEQAMFNAWDAHAEEMRSKAPDFDDVFGKTPIHQRFAPILAESENGGEIGYYLGKNPDVARDLYEAFETAPAKALRMLGRIEAQMSDPPQRKVSTAPKPAPALNGGSNPIQFDAARTGVGDMQAYLRKAGVIS